MRYLDPGLALSGGLEPHARAGLVDHVDGLVRQVALVDVPIGELGRGAQSVVGVLDPVVLFELRLQTRCRISTVSDTDGSATSIFWKRRARA